MGDDVKAVDVGVRAEAVDLDPTLLPAGTAAGMRKADVSERLVLETEDEDGYVHFSSGALTRGTSTPGKTTAWRVSLESGLSEAVGDATGRVVASKLLPAMDKRFVPEPGIEFALDGADGKPTLVLLHGTFSNPMGSFAPLVARGTNGLELTELGKGVFGGYGRVIAYSHRTLGESPVDNAIELLNQLSDAKVRQFDILSHSRGGLIADLLLACGCRRPEVPQSIVPLAKAMGNVVIGRVARVAAPANGTALAGAALPKALEVLFNALKFAIGLDDPVTRYVRDVILAVVRHGLSEEHAPGLAAMNPTSELVEFLRSRSPSAVPTLFLGAELRGSWHPKGWIHKAAAAAAFLLHRQPNDLVISSESMRGGVPRLDVVEAIVPTRDVWHVGYFGSPSFQKRLEDFLKPQEKDAGEERDIAAVSERDGVDGSDPAELRRAVMAAAQRAKLASDLGAPVGDVAIDLAAITDLPFTAASVRGLGDEIPTSRGLLAREDLDARESAEGGESAEKCEGSEEHEGAEGSTVELRLPRVASRRDVAGRVDWPFPSELLHADPTTAGHWVPHPTYARVLQDALLAAGIRLSVTSSDSSFDAELTIGDRTIRVSPPLDPARRRALFRQVLEKVPGMTPARASKWLEVFPDDEAKKESVRGSLIGALARRDSEEIAAWVETIRDWVNGGNRRPPSVGAEPIIPPVVTRVDELVAVASGSLARFGRIAAHVYHGAISRVSGVTLVLPRFHGEPMPLGGGTLERAWDVPLFSSRSHLTHPDRGVIPVAGAATPCIVMHLPPPHRLSTNDVEDATYTVAVESALLGYGSRFGFVSFGGIEEAFSVSRSDVVEAIVRGLDRAREEVEVTQLVLVERYEDLAAALQHELVRVGKRDVVRAEALVRGNGYFGARPRRADRTGRASRWTVQTIHGEHAFEVDDGHSVQQAFRKQAPPPVLAGIPTTDELATQLLPGALWNPRSSDAELTLVLDLESAAYPWEDARSGSERLGLRAPLVRQLIGVPREHGLAEVSLPSAIVIARPLPPTAPTSSDLPWAAREATELSQRLGQLLPNEVQQLVSLDNAKCQLLHIAAHGFARDGGGVILPDGSVLTPAKVQAWRHVPSIVFLNCCEAGSVAADPSLVARLATELMRRGTRALVAAAWNVRDDVAYQFASAFYEHFLNGERFGRAILEARRHAHAIDDGTPRSWPAYQAYGDPSLVVRFAQPQSATYVASSEVLDEIVTVHGELQARRGYGPMANKRAHALWSELEKFGYPGLECLRIGKLFLDLDDEGRALEAFERAMKTTTTRVEVIELYWDLKSRRAFRGSASQADLATAVARLRALSVLRGTADVFRYLGQALLRLDQVDEARIAYAASRCVATSAEEHARIRAEWSLLLTSPPSASKIAHGDKARHALPRLIQSLADAVHTGSGGVQHALDALRQELAKRDSKLATRTTGDLLRLVAHRLALANGVRPLLHKTATELSPPPQ
ncbi:MAG: CHAT domain-containing protein [Myxococcota bacterium]|nr:CHAT domain-containing protein [Myxococcota bacterium]